jgi:hypothetical protein
MIVLGTWVPEDSKPHMEICHAFVYRWLIGRGRIVVEKESDPVSGPFGGDVMKPILFPTNGLPVRTGGVNHVKAGDIVGFFDDNDALIHSMIAETETRWVGANNHGCFGTGTGRSTIADAYAVRHPPGPMGWVDNTSHRFKSMGGVILRARRTKH